MPTARDFIARVSNSSLGSKALYRLQRFDDKLKRLLRFAERHRSIGATEDFYSRVRTKFPDKAVQRGPFAGMRYGAREAMASTFIPKLLGSYENELHPWLENVANKDYDVVVDVGCAEGYYAVGLARLLPGAQVYAYDTHPDARKSCKHMAALNGVADRVTVGGFCDPETLRALDLSSGALIISDCEGYEATLFDAETVAHLAESDLVIECHDLFGSHITRELVEKFSPTHKVTIVETVPDHCKALDLEFPELTEEPYPVRLYMVEEQREAPQNFLILESLERPRRA